MALLRATLLPLLAIGLLGGACATDPPRNRREPGSSTGTGTPSGSTGSTSRPPNILILLADDLGVDKVRSYQPDLSGLPVQPTLDRLAEEGVRFETMWVAPVCSPTRSVVLSGRYPLQTGIGRTVADDSEYELGLGEVLLPELLEHSPHPYADAAFGKWHLASPVSPGGLDHPRLQGFDHYSGAPTNLNGRSYYSYSKLIDGEFVSSEVYVTTDEVNDALAWIQAAPEPWFAYVAFHAPHLPLEEPPPELYTTPIPASPTTLDLHTAMIEALDTEMGRLLDGLDSATRANTTVFFLGDNGTEERGITDPFDPEREKDTLYDGGIRVPLLISGPGVGVPGSSVDILAHGVDLFPTVAELAQVDLAEVGGGSRPGISLVPWMRDPATPPVRDLLYVDAFVPLGAPPYTIHRRAIRDDRWKLIKWEADALTMYQLFDLERPEAVWDEGPVIDVLETAEQQEAWSRLNAAIDEIEAAYPYAPE